VIQGRVVERLHICGKQAVFRYPKFDDLDDLFRLICTIVDEKAMLSIQKKPTRREEIQWLSNLLVEVENRETVHLVLELQGEVVGSASVEREKSACQNHVGHLGIMLRRDIRGKGLGARLLDIIIEEATKVLKVNIMKLRVMGTNETAQKLYRRCGFEEVGRIRNGLRHYDRYADEITMVRYL